ncbi:MAG: acyltransferase domain-containing protein, partial [Pseudomonadota bacterium]
PRCAIGSVKSMIGHTMPAAGIAGVIKAALALYHKVLPPTLNVAEPNPKLELEKTPFYLNTQTRPWMHGCKDTPRRAGVNAFGFGGINAHAILEEHRETEHLPEGALHHHWDSEVFILQGKTREELLLQGEKLLRFLARDLPCDLKNLAFTLNSLSDDTPCRLAIVASSQALLADLLTHALKQLSKKTCARIQDRRGIYYFQEPLKARGKLAFLFPGEGSQYINMLSDLCIHFPEVRHCFDEMDRVFSGHSRGYLISEHIFPPPAFSETERKAAEKKLWEMDGAVEAVLTANDALFTLARLLEIKPDVMLGHSTGEYSAMHASGIFSLMDSADDGQRARDLNRHYAEAAEKKHIPRAQLAAAGADAEKVARVLAGLNSPVYIAMDNCPHQTVIAGAEADVQQAVKEMTSQGIICQILSFDRPYHTPLFKEYADTLQHFFQQWPINIPATTVYSCTTAAPFPADTGAIRQLAVEHWVRPVEFKKTIEKMYADGVRIFVEIGPRGNLTAFVDDILRGKDFVAVPANTERSSGINQLNHLIGILAAHGVPLNTAYLYKYRAPQKIQLHEQGPEKKQTEKTKAVKKIETGWPPITLSDKTVSALLAKSSAAHTANDSFAKTSSGGAEHRQHPRDFFTSGEKEGMPFIALQEIQGALAGEDSRSAVMTGYLQTMEQFLEVQQEVLQTFLGSRHEQDSVAGTGAVQQHTFTVPAAVSRGLAAESTDAPPVRSDTKPEEAEPSLIAGLLEIVSERTGYPADMLDLNLNMEADLGIDSIKRTEIIGALNERYGKKTGQETEQLARLKTLRQIVDFFEAHAGASDNGGTEHVRIMQSPGQTMRADDEASSDRLHAYPMLDSIESLIEGSELVALKRLSLEEDLYLYDHTLGGRISCMDTSLLPLPVMPLTLSMEILAEAASFLEPEALLSGMKNIRTYK